MIRRLLTLAATVVATFLIGTTPAWAHGGPLAIQASSDGGQGVNATVTYAQDGHYVTGEVVMTYTAVSPEGRTIGPFPLKASPEGQSFYVSRNPLPVGKWTVTVTATEPSTATVTISVTSAKLPPVTAPPPVSSGLPTGTLVAIPAAVVVIAFAVVVFLRRRRSAVGA